eukprot:15024075-Heterocapsa_arctica.AAC.1
MAMPSSSASLTPRSRGEVPVEAGWSGPGGGAPPLLPPVDEYVNAGRSPRGGSQSSSSPPYG